MATEQIVKAVIRAAAAPPQLVTHHRKVAFALHTTFAAAGYTLHSFDEAEMGKRYTIVYSNPEKGSHKVRVNALGNFDVLSVDVIDEFTSKHLHLELNASDYLQTGGVTFASNFRNLGKLVEKVNREIFDKLDAALAAKLSNQSSSSETRGIVVSEDADSPRTGDNNFPFLSRRSGSRLGLEDPDNRNGRNNSNLLSSYPRGGEGRRGDLIIGPNNAIFYGHIVHGPGMSGGPSL